jgi:hypothetical protein
MHIWINLKLYNCVLVHFTPIWTFDASISHCKFLDFGILKRFKDSLYFVKLANEWDSLFLWHFNLMNNMNLHNIYGYHFWQTLTRLHSSTRKSYGFKRLVAYAKWNRISHERMIYLVFIFSFVLLRD